MTTDATLTADAIVDRRRLRRRLTVWRVSALALAAIAVIAFTMRSGDGSPSTGFGAGRQIARVQIEGIITDNRDQLKMLRKLAKANNVEAVVLHINSPGGTTTGGEALFEALREVGEKKPLVSVFGTMATSAAYIAGLGTDHIVSRGNTITGSVGVIFQWAEVSQLLDKLGVKVNEVKSGPLKAVPSMFEPLNEQGRQLTADMVAESQTWFLSLVASRRNIDPLAVSGLAQGRIFSGRQALEHKLVDAIGGEKEAVRWLEDKRGIKKNLKIVDWKIKPEGSWSLSGSIANGVAGLAGSLLGPAASEILAKLGGNGVVARLQLDGLVSVWHVPIQ